MGRPRGAAGTLAPRAARRALALASLLAVAASCAGEPRRPPAAPSPARAPSAQGAAPKPLSDYVLAEPAAPFVAASLPLDKDAIGALIDGMRVVSDQGAARVSKSSARDKLTAVDRIPTWLGGGFLFRGGSSLYRSDSFDGPLTPLVTLPERVLRVSFGPKTALVRGVDGDRWAFYVPSWMRAPIAPAGLVAVEALGDGRALAIAELGRALVSTSDGAQWDDVTSKLAGAPADVRVIGGDLWLKDETGRAYRLEEGGALREYDRLPEQGRAKGRDPRWHGAASPQRAAMERGAPLDDKTALVVSGGDIARVDVRSGALVSIAPGRLPPAMTCEAMRAADDVVVVCVGAGSSLVASGLLHDDPPKIERTFASEGPFYASDDGGLVFGGPCSPDRPAHRAACARGAHGKWEPHSLDVGDVGDAGAAAGKGPIAPRPEVLRWVPREGAPPLAILSRESIETISPSSTKSVPWKVPAGMNLAPAIAPPPGLRGGRGRVIDRTWTITESGSLLGWLAGRGVEVSASGAVTPSPFDLDALATSGARALGKTRDGRAFQSLDHGVSWAEVAAPPVWTPFGSQGCSAVGCDIGAWLRVGWPPSPPAPAPPPEIVEAPPRLPRPGLPALTCVAAGEARTSSLRLSVASPDDFGLGARAVPVSHELPSGQAVVYVKSAFSRGLINPVREAPSEDETAPRILVHGFGIEWADANSGVGSPARFVVLGPSRSPSAFRRDFTFFEPLDPAGSIRSASLGMGEIAAIAPATGLSLEQILAGGGMGAEGFVPVLPLDPAGATDLAFTIRTETGDILATLTAGQAPRVKLWAARHGGGSLVSAAALPGGDVAVLSADEDGRQRVIRLSSGGAAEIAEISPPPQTALAPSNPDALAVGPQGSLAILRMPSGGEPPSRGDPALLYRLPQGSAAGGVIVPERLLSTLAPWSTLLNADDPACRKDSGGFRAIVQARVPWVELLMGRSSMGPGDAPFPAMTARVRWSAERVCLEAIELPEPPINVPAGSLVPSFIVARLAAPAAAGRVGALLGTELRQALGCVLSGPPQVDSGDPLNLR